MAAMDDFYQGVYDFLSKCVSEQRLQELCPEAGDVAMRNAVLKNILTSWNHDVR
ncbi:MAG: hypothetical protein H6908_02925 [Hyphomicrobiales bacterium]|nr:hypothetical protein [Hyphomicrobiales bacterium]